MAPSPTILKLAAIAHELWREQMLRDGWKHGPAFDRERRTHDALVPFERLSPQDRRHACLGIECAELERQLVFTIVYQRGPDREFAAEELRPGLEVGLCDPAQPDGLSGIRGVVERWQADAQGELVIFVRWSTGELSEHLACERELVRLPS